MGRAAGSWLGPLPRRGTGGGRDRAPAPLLPPPPLQGEEENGSIGFRETVQANLRCAPLGGRGAV